MGSRARLNAALSQKTATKFTVSREQTVTQTLTLTNPSDASYRLFALWHLVNRISILVDVGSDPFVFSSQDFISAGSIVVTSFDMPARDR